MPSTDLAIFMLGWVAGRSTVDKSHHLSNSLWKGNSSNTLSGEAQDPTMYFQFA